MTKNYNYDAFGNERAPSEEDTNPFRYCGEYYDTETGLYYLRARYYDPLIGRFTQEDTYRGDAKDPLSLNYYTYCYNNPVVFLDPDGNMPVFAINNLCKLYIAHSVTSREVTRTAFFLNGLNLYTAFHEIAQINLARQLHFVYGYSPVLEYRIDIRNEADIVANGMVWEVKPITRRGLKQIQRYMNAGNLSAGHTFPMLYGIPIYGKYMMAIIPSLTEPGVAHYFFYYYNKDGEYCTVTTKQMWELLNDVQDYLLLDPKIFVSDSGLSPGYYGTLFACGLILGAGGLLMEKIRLESNA